MTLVNIGLGLYDAKTVTDRHAVLQPDLMLMIGHYAGPAQLLDIGTWCWRPASCARTVPLATCCR